MYVGGGSPLAVCWHALSTPKWELEAYGWAGGIFPTEINPVQCLTEGSCKRCIIHEVRNQMLGVQTRVSGRAPLGRS